MPDGTSYNGEFENGIKDGIGDLIFNDSSSYSGFFKND